MFDNEIKRSKDKVTGYELEVRRWSIVCRQTVVIITVVIIRISAIARRLWGV